MPGRYLFDTNAVIALFADDSDVLARLEAAQEVFVLIIVLGELHYGARRSGRVERNLARLVTFTTGSVMLNCDDITARYYGEIKDGLRRDGRPIPENDIWIAAVASQHNLTVLTRDTHLAGLPGVAVEGW
jgi:tRNA(fMet)-specific endonuclease VapC